MSASSVTLGSGPSCTLEVSGRTTTFPELEHLAAVMPSTNIDSVRSQSRMSISHAKGLLNKPGQNNCFLNSAVQVLWHLDVFRRSFRELHGHACMADSCIFCALKELFDQFQSSKESALPPDSLRFALAEAFSDQRRFQLGFMDDAAECFENILLRIHSHLTNQEVSDTHSQCLPHCIPHQKFAMNLVEQISCHACGATSEPFTFSQMVHYASTSALCLQEKLFKSDNLSFGSLLRMATSMGDIRNCPKMCGTRINIKKVLLNRPDVISVGLVWDSEHPTLALIRNVFQLMETSLRLHEVFDLNSSPIAVPNATLNLVGLVTYYGKHYSTYLYHTKRHEWIYFDDATVRVIGPCWQQVVDKCVKGHFQPLLLLYANPNGTVVNTEYAFHQVLPMTAIKRHNSTHDQVVSSAVSLEVGKGASQGSLPLFANHKPLRETSYLDLPDSPSATSTTSYFSDLGDSTDGYISRKTVENILKIQQSKQKKEHSEVLGNFNKRNNRNSSSSLDSFDSAVRLNSLPRNFSMKSTLIASLQRRDSGNSSGDRASSVSSMDTPYYPYRRNLKSANRKSNKQNSDQGYDSFSVSSSDSYPSTATSPSKMSNSHKLRQIPEDVQLMEIINLPRMAESDQLCSEADILLLKSHEKEHEGDLRAAAALSDSAAAKARIAMDAPYSNHQTLIMAKKKYSICVMRSTSLHKRVQEMEVEEKRLIKAALEYHHNRQSSRDSSHGRHSRQGSKDSKDPRAAVGPVDNVQIYATLPKKNSKRKTLLKTSNSNLTSEGMTTIPTTTYLQCPQLPANSILRQLHEEKFTKPPVVNKDNRAKKELVRDSDFSDYYSEWEGLKKKGAPVENQSNSSGWQSCRENDSEVYGEIGPIQSSIAGKHCKVKRKLLLGGLLKSKNRSMPDLRENDCNGQVSGEDGANRALVANIRANGFHQSHRSFVNEQGLSSKPSLLKVKPPLIGEVTSLTCQNNAVLGQEECIYANTSQIARLAAAESPTSEQANIEKPNKSTKCVQSVQNPFLVELNKKRMEILKYDRNGDGQVSWSPPCNTKCNGGSLITKKPSSREIVNFISKNITTSQGIPIECKPKVPNRELSHRMEQLAMSDTKYPVVEPCPKMASIHMPIPVHGSAVPQQVATHLANQSRPSRPPDYETALKRLEMKTEREGTFPVPPPATMSASLDRAFLNPLEIQNERRRVMENKYGSAPVYHRLDRSVHHSISAHSDQLSKCRPMAKKSVKFSDHIELVACADDHEEEEHLPNPLLEKVLSNKNVVYTLQ